nr:hypothetical protein [Tanacetum cinerariifolium]
MMEVTRFLGMCLQRLREDEGVDAATECLTETCAKAVGVSAERDSAAGTSGVVAAKTQTSAANDGAVGKLAGTCLPAAATIIPAGSSMDAVVHAAAPSSSILAVTKGKAPMEVEFSRHEEELAQKAQPERVASPTEHGPGLSDQCRRELDAAQLIYTEVDWVEFLAKIATNSALSKQLLGDDVTEDNMNERLGMLLLRKR